MLLSLKLTCNTGFVDTFRLLHYLRNVLGNSVMLSSGTEVPFGVCVWSTGNTALDFVRQLGLPLSRDGRILVDAQLAVQGAQDVYAMGDCAVNPQEPLPMIAQVIKCLGS